MGSFEHTFWHNDNRTLLNRHRCSAFERNNIGQVSRLFYLQVLTTPEIMQQINKFSKEFENYTNAVDKVRVSFQKLDADLGAIATDGTRFRKLRVPIRDIEKLRRRQGVPELDGDDPADHHALDA